MKRFLLVPFNSAVWAGPTVPVWIQGGPDSSSLFVTRARFIAAEFLNDAGVRIRLVDRQTPNAIAITLEHSAALNQNNERRGAAEWIEGTNIRSSPPKLRMLSREHRLADLLASVMVQEFAHILQANDGHAPEAISKAKSGTAEFRSMANRSLSFTGIEVERIQAARAQRKTILAGNIDSAPNFALMNRRIRP